MRKQSDVERSISAAKYLATELTFPCNERGRFPYESIAPAVQRITRCASLFPSPVVAAISRNDAAGAEMLAQFIEANAPDWKRPQAKDIGGPRTTESLWMRIYQRVSKALSGAQRLETHRKTGLAESRRSAGKFTDGVIAESLTEYEDGNSQQPTAYDISVISGFSERTVRRRLNNRLALKDT